MATQNYRRGDEVCCWCPEYGERGLWFKGRVVGIPEIGRYNIHFIYYSERYFDRKFQSIHNIKKCRVQCTQWNRVVDAENLMPFNADNHTVYTGRANQGYITTLHHPPSHFNDYDRFRPQLRFASSPRKPLFQCTYCSIIFDVEEELYTHSGTCTGQQCALCVAKCADWEEFVQHRRDVHQL